MVCVLAMYCGATYEQIAAAARASHLDYDPQISALAPALMRRVAHAAGVALLSSIYFDWRFPGIIGVPSKRLPGEGHALFWDGERIIDPGGSDAYEREWVEREAVEYAQRASDLAAVFSLDQEFVAARSTRPPGARG